MSFGHDGYIAEVMKPYLRDGSLHMLRFHSFYPWHKHNAYDHHLWNDKGRSMLDWILKFNRYDLYSKADTKPNLKELKPYYEELFAEFLSATLAW
jgi:inositol oxygenase